MRIAYFKKYWDKFKYNRARREYLIETFDEASEQLAYYLGDEFKDWRDEIPGAREFLKEVESKQTEKTIEREKLGTTTVRVLPGHTEIDNLQEVEYSPYTFNPFDAVNIRTAEKNLRKVYIERDVSVIEGGGSSEDHGLTLGSSATDRGSSEVDHSTEMDHTTSSGQSSEGESNEIDGSDEEWTKAT